MPKDITTDELARLIKERFDHVDQKLNAMETRLTARLDHIENTILKDYGRCIERLENALALPRP